MMGRQSFGDVTRAVHEWLRAGNEATAREISAVLGFNCSSVRNCLQKLREGGYACVASTVCNSRRGETHVYRCLRDEPWVWCARVKRVPQSGMLVRALQKRTPLERVWAGFRQGSGSVIDSRPCPW